MAYRNSEGRITIDDVAAKNDIRKENEAKQILISAEKMLEELIMEASECRGATARAISERANDLKRQTQRLINNLDSAQNYTQSVVTRYKIIDQRCKDALRK